MLNKGYTNPRHQVTVATEVFVVPNIRLSSVWSLL
jgi:hypothetical protein